MSSYGFYSLCSDVMGQTDFFRNRQNSLLKLDIIHKGCRVITSDRDSLYTMVYGCNRPTDCFYRQMGAYCFPTHARRRPARLAAAAMATGGGWRASNDVIHHHTHTQSTRKRPALFTVSTR